MNKKLSEAFAQAGVVLDKNRGYGVVNGFETNVIVSSMQPAIIHFSCYATDEQKRSILQTLAGEKIKFAQFSFSPFGLSASINDWTTGSLAKRLDSVLETICSALKSNGALGVGYCPVCGNALDFENSKKCNVKGMTISLDNVCVENINGLINEENKAIAEAPNNYLRGFAGALVGSLAGAAIAVVLYLIGFISALSAFVAFFVGELLYRKFGGKPNVIMVVTLACTVFAAMLLTVFGIYLVAAAEGAKANGIDMNAFEAFKVCMQDEEIRGGFISDMLLTVLFSVLGCAYEIYALCKRIKRPQNI